MSYLVILEKQRGINGHFIFPIGEIFFPNRLIIKREIDNHLCTKSFFLSVTK